jgi:hypothetical protein
VFYSIFEWQERKGPTETLEAYFRAFPRDGDHLLVLKTNPSAVAVGQQAIERARVAARSTARVSLIAEGWSEAQIDALHRRGDCYVSLHRGEGWGYPLFEAAIRAKSIVATAYSGPLDYLTPQEAGLVPFTLAPVRQPYVYYRPSMMWAEPKVQDAAALMREAFGARKCAATGRAEYAERLQRSYSVAHVGAMAKDRLLQLLSMHNQPRWHEIHLHALPPPTVPISGDWYDEDYFESGLKSNWRNGYSWRTFGPLFRETASYVIEMFPEAHSYLDAGCAKGLLVRALREAGKECRGFDHSAWAIEHADESARPFLRLAGVDDLTFDRHVDVLLAFDLFSQLSEEQARAFLVRVRQVTRMALVSVITSFEDDDEQLRYEGGGAADRDRSHVTRRQRRWWHTLFTESGWKLDALHRLGAERCQRHPLPTRMGWKMYVYAP